MTTRTDSDYVIDMAGTDGIAMMTHPRYGRQVWVRCQVRKDSRCTVTGAVIRKGQTAYRPLTNQNNRMERICEQVIKDYFSCK